MGSEVAGGLALLGPLVPRGFVRASQQTCHVEPASHARPYATDPTPKEENSLSVLTPRAYAT